MDLTTTYLGLKLRSPLVVGAAEPLSKDLDTLKQLEEAGAAAIVLHSIFEEQIQQDELTLHHHLEYGSESFAEALSYFPQTAELFHVGAEHYLSQICEAKENLDIPIIASLNGTSMGGWVEYAQNIEQAGADAIELNLYSIPTDLHRTGVEIEAQYLEVVRRIRALIKLPLTVKLSPFFSSTANMAQQIQAAGADGLVLFNRFYQPDIDIEALDVRPNLILSTPKDMRLPMHWIAILYGRIALDFAATSGIHHAPDIIRLLMAGAKVTLLVSTLLRHGISYIANLEKDLIDWLTDHEYESVSSIIGTMSQLKSPNPSAFERVQYLKTLQTYHPYWLSQPEPKRDVHS